MHRRQLFVCLEKSSAGNGIHLGFDFAYVSKVGDSGPSSGPQPQRKRTAQREWRVCSVGIRECAALWTLSFFVREASHRLVLLRWFPLTSKTWGLCKLRSGISRAGAPDFPGGDIKQWLRTLMGVGCISANFGSCKLWQDALFLCPVRPCHVGWNARRKGNPASAAKAFLNLSRSQWGSDGFFLRSR